MSPAAEKYGGVLEEYWGKLVTRKTFHCTCRWGSPLSVRPSFSFSAVFVCLPFAVCCLYVFAGRSAHANIDQKRQHFPIPALEKKIDQKVFFKSL